jgi:V/A-type H+-transporting ATPase subunit I
MAKVEIIGPKNCFFDLVSLLHENGSLHIEDLGKHINAGDVSLDRMQPAPERADGIEKEQDVLIRVRAIIKALALPGTGKVDSQARQLLYDQMWAMTDDELAAEVTGVVGEVEERTAALAAEKSALESETAMLTRYEPVLQKIQPLAKQIVTTGSYDSIALLIERRYKGALEELKKELNRITHNQCEIVATDVDEDTTAVIVVFSKAYSEPVHHFLAAENVNQIRLPSELQDVPFDSAYETVVQRRGQLPAEQDRVRDELGDMSERWMLKLSTIRDVLSDKLAEYEAIPKFGQTSYAFVVTGWLPLSGLTKLRDEIKSKFGDKIVVDQVEIRDDEMDETPVVLSNPSFIKPFESLLFISGQPKYGTIDPTWFIFLFYPLFFGMIVGDVGYGLVMMGIILWARSKYKDNANVQMGTSILGPAATLVIAFGVLYGEFFGNLLTGIFHILPVVNAQGVVTAPGLVPAVFAPNGMLIWPFPRTEMIVPFIALALGVGLIQVVFGLILGMVNGVRTKHMKHVYEKGGMLAVLLGVIGLIAFVAVLAVPFTAMFGGNPWGGYGVQAFFALLIFGGAFYAAKGGGIVGVVESISMFANVASYIRIMAVGLAGALFADAINQLAVKMGNPVLGLVIAIPLHVLSFAIAVFSPSIHALRLNFLEFFNKFYESGGEQYKPFQKTGGGA